MGVSDDAIEAAISRLGDEVWEAVRRDQPSLFSPGEWQSRLLAWVMQDASFKVDLFRFVDVLPTLTTREAVARHIKEYLLREGRNLPTAVDAALRAASGTLTSGLGAMAIRKNVADMAGRFIAGKDAKSALGALRDLHKIGVGFTADLLGEAAVSENEANVYVARYEELLNVLAAEVSRWGAATEFERNHVGPIPRINVSVKISALYSQVDPMDHVNSVFALRQKLEPFLVSARAKNAFVNFDLEQWALHDITYDLFEELVTIPALRDWPHLGIVVQAYLRTATNDVQRLLSIARGRGTPLTVRLVKGAYWDYETVIARQRHWPCPVFEDKQSTDANFEALSRELLTVTDWLWPAFGSHNLRSLLHAIAVADAAGLAREAYEIQMLHGMAEPEREAFRRRGHRLRVYAPIGELLPGIAYLVRRLLENTSNTGFLRMTHHEQLSRDVLLAKPNFAAQPATVQRRMIPGDIRSPFENCALTDFGDKEARNVFSQAIEAASRALPVKVPIVLAGKVTTGTDEFVKHDPSDLRREVARVSAASVEDAARAVSLAKQGFATLRTVSLEQRALLLERLADRLEKDRMYLAALETLEVGKPWKEADADVAEAVDFCRYYARRAWIELGGAKQELVPGEDNTLFYVGRGPAVVIAPWNFPIAILCGMTTAAFVAGNSVILKPAEQSSATAFALFQRMMDVGFPTEAVQFLPGYGETIGPYLVDHPEVALVAFTGSEAVGLQILERAARTTPGQLNIKNVICEMGGKNAIIVDDDADLDEAVLGTLHSAFGYSGQKCSACSRVLVHRAVYDTFVKRLVEATKNRRVGPAYDPATVIGPVVDAEAQTRLLTWLKDKLHGVEIVYQGEVPHGGAYVPPTILAVRDPSHPVMQEELFGPVLAVLQVESFDQALEVANSTRYALTGGIFSRSPVHLERAIQEFNVGNLYLNRACTGAMVGRQPFGGFHRSGTGTKAGGPGYLTRFADPKCVTENTMRRGFIP